MHHLGILNLGFQKNFPPKLICTGAGWLGRLWSFHPWEYFKAIWTWCRCRWPCLSRGVGPDYLRGPLPPNLFCSFLITELQNQIVSTRQGTLAGSEVWCQALSLHITQL